MMRPALLLAAAALAGCDAAPARQPQAVAAAEASPERDRYQPCLDEADGDASAIRQCADAAVAAAGARVPKAGRAFADALPVLGDDAIERGQFGAGASGTVDAAQAAVRLARARAALLLGGGEDAPAAPVRLGRAAEIAWNRARATDCAAYPVARCRVRYDGLLTSYLPRRTAMADAETTGTSDKAGLPLPTCAEVRGSALVGGALADEFYRRYPKPLADPASVGDADLDAAALDNVVRYLACVAALTEYDPVVVDNGLALFADPRHGAAALAQLEALSRADGPDAVGAKGLLEQVRPQLGRH